MKLASRIMKVLLVLSTVLAMFSFVLTPEQIYAEDFSKDEDYYYDLCSSKSLTSAQKTTCTKFREYLSSKQKTLEGLIKKNEQELANIKNNIINEGERIASFTTQIEDIEVQITRIEKSVTKIETNVTELTVQIEERTARIDELNSAIKARMEANQANISNNNYIRFIMGASSFVDLLRRISAINEITSYDRLKVEEMEDEKVLLEADIKELEEQKSSLIEEQGSLEALKVNLEKLKKQTQELIDEFQRKEQLLYDTLEDQVDDLDVLESAMKDIDKALDSFFPSDGWSKYLLNRFHVTSKMTYSGGGWHGALDAAAATGSKAYAVANGVVVSVGTGCSTGYLGNKCNSGRGNYVIYIVQVHDACYIIHNYHFKSVNVKVGDNVYGGKTVVGLVGSTGNSSGHHLHLGMIYLGKISMTQAINWYKRQPTRAGAKNTEAWTCNARGNSAPCIVDPQPIFKTYYPYYYN